MLQYVLRDSQSYRACVDTDTLGRPSMLPPSVPPAQISGHHMQPIVDHPGETMLPPSKSMLPPLVPSQEKTPSQPVIDQLGLKILPSPASSLQPHKKMFSYAPREKADDKAYLPTEKEETARSKKETNSPLDKEPCMTQGEDVDKDMPGSTAIQETQAQDSSNNKIQCLSPENKGDQDMPVPEDSDESQSHDKCITLSEWWKEMQTYNFVDRKFGNVRNDVLAIENFSEEASPTGESKLTGFIEFPMLEGTDDLFNMFDFTF